MKRLFSVPVVAMLSTLVSCGGGGGGGGTGLPIRTVQMQFKPGTISTHTDPASGITVSLTDSALPQAQPVRLIFSENWDNSPRSRAIKKLTSVIVECVDELAVDSITLTAPIGNRVPSDLRFVTLGANGWIEANNTVQGSLIEATDDSRARALKSRAGQQRQYGLILAPYSADFSETSVDLVKLAGVGNENRIESGGACILWHGMNNTVKDMQTMADYMVNNHVFSAAYAVKYPWGDEIAQNGQMIAGMLRDRISAGVKVTMLAHSMGGLVASYAVERRDLHESTNATVLVGTPRQGATLAVLTKVCRAQANQNLNDPNDTPDHWAGLCDLNTPSVRNMQKNSSFLQELNGPPLRHSTIVPYFLFAGIVNDWGAGVTLPVCPVDCDGLIEKSNLLGYQYEGNCTLGRVVRVEVPRNHAELITSSDALAKIAEVLSRMTNLGPVITASAPNGNRASNTGWDIKVRVANNLVGLDLDSESLPMASFQRDGEWEITQWYDKSTGAGQFYPDTPREWRERINAGSLTDINVHLSFDQQKHTYNQVETNMRSKTVIFACHGTLTLTNQTFSVSQACEMLDMDGNGPTGKPRHVHSTPKPGNVFSVGF